MRVRVTFEATRPIRLPLHYNHAVQSLIYSLLGDYGRGLHDGTSLPGVVDVQETPTGEEVEESPSAGKGEATRVMRRRPYKFFVFSRLFFEGRYRIVNGSIFYEGGPVRLEIASAQEELTVRLSEALFSGANRVEIGGADLGVRDVTAVPRCAAAEFEPILVRALSPITCRSTLYTADGRPKSCFYDPNDSEWPKRILGNLLRKGEALWGREHLERVCGDNCVERSGVKPVRVGAKDHRRTRFMGRRIEGYSGLYELKLPRPLFYLALDTGLGERNSMGYGMIEAAEKRRGARAC